MCDCGQNDCILKSRKTYNKYFEQQKTEHLIKGEDGGICDCCLETTFYRHSKEKTKLVSKVPPKWKNHACDHAKQSIKYYFLVDSIMEINQGYHLRHEKQAKMMDEAEVDIIKLKQLYRKSLASSEKLQNDIKKEQTQIKDLRAELRQLKKENKKIKYALICESDEEEDEAGETIPPLITKPTNPESDVEILYRYQRIKDYLVAHELSITRLCRRLGMEQQRTFVCERFIDLKVDRINIAHPEAEPITTDQECIALILNQQEQV